MNRPTHHAAWVSAVLALLGSGCLSPAGYHCEADTQCDLDGKRGRCQRSGYCAYPDGKCPSGLRYEREAESDLGGRCVPSSSDAPTETSTGVGPTTSTSTDAGSTGGSGTVTGP